MKNIYLKLIIIFIISFLMGINNIFAASFKYSEFDFDKFAEENNGYWINECSDSESSMSKCKDPIIVSQKKFYTRLYKLLASKENKGYLVDDKIIIQTVFFNYEPSSFNDESSAYNLDNDENVEDDGENASAEFFEQETDTLKLLVNAMIGYESVCYGVTDPIVAADESLACREGSLDENNKCLVPIKTRSLSFWEKFADSVTSFFGIQNNNSFDCDAYTKSLNYSSGKNITSGSKVVEEGYWEFLEQGNYFDNKPNLQNYYQSILDKEKVNSIKDLSAAKKEAYHDELVEIRKEIVSDIKSILDNYNEGRAENVKLNNARNDSYWWPIGSTTVTQNGNNIFATGDPASVAITSNYGVRVHPVYGTTRKHFGLDLGGIGGNGETNIIAAKSGTVVAVNTNCFSTTDSEDHCGGGYGNYVEILHDDGLYTFYAHMHQNTITVKEGQSVTQGQVIGKMGTSGVSTGTHLHFEVRTGPNQATAVDPLGYIDPSNPRPSSTSNLGQFLTMVIGFEGAGPSRGDNYIVYCDEGDVPTVGAGVTLRDNAGDFASFGYHLNGVSPFRNYCGQEIPKSVVDQVFGLEIENWANYVKRKLSSAGLTLPQHQIDALTDLCYNGGSRMDDFLVQYNNYGASEALCSNWWNNYFIKNQDGKVLQGLKTRRYKECNYTFLKGIYDGSYS